MRSMSFSLTPTTETGAAASSVKATAFCKEWRRDFITDLGSVLWVKRRVMVVVKR